MKNNISNYHYVEITENGKKYSGEYKIERGMIVVEYGEVSATTQKSYNNQVLAKLLLKELVKKQVNV